MSTEVAKDFAKLSAYYMIKSTGESGQKSDFYLKKSNDIGKLIQDLKKGNYKDKIISECAKLFYDSEFESKLNQNNYLVGFTNGIYDLKNKLFRNGCPDDYVSKTTGYKYTEFNNSDQIIIDIKKFFASIQPAEDMRKYILCYCASLLEGGNKEQKFMIWTGSGSNSKGTLIDLLDNTFGEYFGTLPVTLLTQKRKGSSGATPELADKYGVRCLTLQEPEEDDKINIGFMKELTGQDKIMARPLYGDPFYYIPQFKILLACNKLPTIPSDDGGTWRRIRVIDFAQRFVSNPTLPNEQKIDPSLREKIKTWNQALMWLLINEYYPTYSSDGLDHLEPECVKLSTSKYKQDSNIYIEFVNENYDFDSQKGIPRDSVWIEFKNWYSNAYSDKKPPQRKKLIEFFQTNNYKIIKGNIMGIKYKDGDEDNTPSQIDSK
jgi:P4 family phage/plasmid primase-like protien